MKYTINDPAMTDRHNFIRDQILNEIEALVAKLRTCESKPKPVLEHNTVTAFRTFVEAIRYSKRWRERDRESFYR